MVLRSKVLLLVGVFVCAVQCVIAGEQVLFNGKDLTGWEGNTNVWRVKDGVIAGGHLAGNPRNEFLATTNSYGNFILRFEYRIVAPGDYNSGVQFRSERIDKPVNEMKGYQADIGPGIAGALYDESRRNRFLSGPPAELSKQLDKKGEWNKYEVRCEGTRIRLFLNGQQTVDYTEPEEGVAASGKIALQVHGGASQECWFRNIIIEEMNDEK